MTDMQASPLVDLRCRRRRARALLTRLFASAPSRDQPECPICLDAVPTAHAGGPHHDRQLGVTLRCGHAFCLECVRTYADGKVHERRVRADQLVCPVVACKRRLHDRDLRRVLDSETFQQYKRTLQRVRDEKHPLARWCPRPQCGELVLCAAGTSTFTCPVCTAVGCFHCRGPAHRFALLCRAIPLKSEDAAYLQWEQSVGGDQRAVRACPKCRMRIWKHDGCNHLTCAHCHHQYCWACDAPWHRRHYACGDDEGPLSATDGLRRRAAQVGLVVVRVVVALLAVVSAIVLAPIVVLVALVRKLPQVVRYSYTAIQALVLGALWLLALPFLLVLTIRFAFDKSKPQRPRP